jgi:hypothetical protein
VLDEDELDAVGATPQTFHQTVDAVPGQTEDCVDTPVSQTTYKVFGGNSAHRAVLS